MKNSCIRGICYMILNTFSLGIIYVLVKEIENSGMPSAQIVFFYKLSCFFVMLPWILRKGFSVLSTDQIPLHIVRGALSAAGSLFFMYSIQYVKLANATALLYLENVMWVLIAMIFFGERFAYTKILAILVSFMGAVIIVFSKVVLFFNNNKILSFNFDDLNEYNHYYKYTIFALLAWTLNSVLIKVIGKKCRNDTQLFYSLLFSSLFSLPIAFIDLYASWQNSEIIFRAVPTFYVLDIKSMHLYYFFFITLFYVVHSVSLFKALQKTDMSILAPYNYFQLLFVGVLSYLFFDQLPSNSSYIGYAFIVGSGIFLARRTKKKIL